MIIDTSVSQYLDFSMLLYYNMGIIYQYKHICYQRFALHRIIKSLIVDNIYDQ